MWNHIHPNCILIRSSDVSISSVFKAQDISRLRIHPRESGTDPRSIQIYCEPNTKHLVASLYSIYASPQIYTLNKKISLQLRNQTQVLETLKRIRQTLKRVNMTRPSKLPRLIYAQSACPSSLKYPVLVSPCSRIPGRFSLRHASFITDPVPHFTLVIRPFCET